MSTPNFKPLWLAMSSIALTGMLFVAVVILLMSVSARAERDLSAFPFKDEDWLRYLLPIRFEAQIKDRLLLAGPSTVRENFRYERFAEKLSQFDVYQGGISLATLDDVNISLSYIAEVYGVAALPDVMVLGISPRFIAGIPAERPFAKGLDRYSPHYFTSHQQTGIRLYPKNLTQSIRARYEFLVSKQSARFRTALLAVVSHWLYGKPQSGGLSYRVSVVLDQLWKSRIASRLLSFTGKSVIGDHSFKDVLQFVVSPYKYSLKERKEYASLRRMDGTLTLDGWWNDVYTWNPEKGNQQTVATLNTLFQFVQDHNIRLMVINMPERNISRKQFIDTTYQAYLQLVADNLPEIEIIDLKDFLSATEFYDLEHSTVDGSLRLSDEVIQLIQTSDTLVRAGARNGLINGSDLTRIKNTD